MFPMPHTSLYDKSNLSLDLFNFVVQLKRCIPRTRLREFNLTRVLILVGSSCINISQNVLVLYAELPIEIILLVIQFKTAATLKGD